MSDPEIEKLLAEARGGKPPPPEPDVVPVPEAIQRVLSMPEPGEATGGPAAATTATGPGGTPTGPGLLEHLLQLRVAGILTSRYVDLKLGDFWGTLILVVQAPLIGFLVTLAFEQETLAFQFVLAMISVWFGTFNSCREVVKERLIFLRERRAGVTVRAYLVSKIGVLAFLSALQCLLLVVVLLVRDIRFDSDIPLVFLALWATSLSATCLGLFLSSVVKSQNSLIALVPIVLIPQLIFSEAITQNRSDLVTNIELGMMAHWGLEILRELRQGPEEWIVVFKGLTVLLAMGLGLFLLAGICLRAQDE